MNRTRSDTCLLSLPISALCNTRFHGTSTNLLFHTHHTPHVLSSHSFSHHSLPRVPFLLVLPVVFCSFLQYPSLPPSRLGDFFLSFFKFHQYVIFLLGSLSPLGSFHPVQFSLIYACIIHLFFTYSLSVTSFFPPRKAYFFRAISLFLWRVVSMLAIVQSCGMLKT